jgi:hypothetical protein
VDANNVSDFPEITLPTGCADEEEAVTSYTDARDAEVRQQ